MDPNFMRSGAHLQVAKVCGITVNCLAIAVSGMFYNPLHGHDTNAAFNAKIVFNAYVNAEFSALSRCLDSSLGSEETKRRKAILRAVRHNIELCTKVSELISPNILPGFRHRTLSCVDGILDAIKSTSAECEEMVRHSESAQRRLVTARKALSGFTCYFKVYRNLKGNRDLQRWERGRYTCALIHTMGSLFSMYRGYASTGNTEHVIPGIIGHCLKILLSLPDTIRNVGAYEARKAYVDMCSVYEDIEQHLIPGLLLNPQVEIPWRNTALRYLSVMMNIWEERYGRHFNAVEQTGGSPSQPSTSGLGSTGARVGGPQASYVPPYDPGMMPSAYAQPSTSWDQPSTSGLGGTAGMGGSQASYMPPHDPGSTPYSYAQPSTSWDQPSTSGLGGTAGMGIQQASYVPPHDSGGMPYPYAQPLTSWDQPSTLGLGGAGAGLGSRQASYVPPHDSGGMPYPYAQPSTSWDQPSTSGLGSAGAGLGSQQASHIPPHDPGIMPYAYAQPSTSGLGGTGSRVRGPQASYIPPYDPGMMPSAYAQPSTLWDQPSTSGMGGAGTMLEEARISSPRSSRTPSDDDSEPP
ncbi:HGE-14 family type IV secretion system effector, partial [Anaplasma phagocytophilum]|uniref:HGE-14 family type IV secretion system effector n=1 Tax=Anaplasma phagocytophilum TaxID=948 RepID=UPI0018C87111